MNPSQRNLDVVQRWMQAVIIHPDGIAAGIESDDARRQIEVAAADVEQVIRRSQALNSIERLEIYGNAYYARLLECLASFFPALVQLLGEDNFNSFAFAYLQSHPSQSYTLSRLADHFVDFLRETRPADMRDEIGWADFLIDLANFEYHIDKVFDGPGVEGKPLLSAEDLQHISPDAFPDARLIPPPCLELLSFQFPVNDYYTAFREDAEPGIPAPEPTYVALTRRDYIVRRYPLSHPQYEMLECLAGGGTIGAAIERAAAVFEDLDDLEQLAESLRTWFQYWAAAGFFQRVEQ